MFKDLLQQALVFKDLAKEAKMATQIRINSDMADHERDLLSEQIRAADYMASHFEAEYRNTNSIMTATAAHTCMVQCRKHRDALQAKMLAILDAEQQRDQYLRDSV